MDYFAGLDVSLETVSICIVNAAGDVVLERKVEAEPAAIAAVLLLIPPIFHSMRSKNFEVQRWMQSDYPPIRGGN